MGTCNSTDDFIRLAKGIHGQKFDYSSCKYIKSKGKVTIVCPYHGPFSQRASSHLEGYGCKRCAMEMLTSKNTLTTADFIIEAMKIHGERYDYSESVYEGSDRLISIVCHDHGKFIQRASSHLEGRGCRSCRDKKAHDDNIGTVEDFVKFSVSIHGDSYSYNKSFYGNSKTKLIITCKLHGDFLQTPSKHLAGHGCTLCGHSKRGAYKTTVYFAYFPINQLFKIGTTADIVDRVNTLNSAVKEKPLILNYKVYEKDHVVHLIEKNLLDHMSKVYGVCKDNFCGHTECFRVTPEKLHLAEKYIYDFMSSGKHLNKIIIPFQGGGNEGH